jgi:putative ABC transport system substrate-binding protein
MNVKSVLIITLITVVTLGRLFYVLNKSKQKIGTTQSYRVAIFEPASHPAMDEIAQGYIDTITKNSSADYTFKRYNANGNQTLLRALAEEIIQQNYDLVMTIGTNASKTVYELTTKKQLSTPIVFDAVSDPVSIGLVKSLSSSGNNVTGVEDIPDYKDQINKLLELKPSTKNMLLVYDPVQKSGVHDIWAEEITQLAAQKGVTVHYAKVFSTNEISAKVQPMLNNIDVLMIFTDHTTVSGVDSLITLCNRYGITLYASDLNSGDKGAALAYGVLQYDLGVDAAKLTLKILEDHIKPTDLPVTGPKINKLKINTKTMAKQGLTLSDEQRENIKKNSGIFV